jgi:diguanylate cyclase (GGDEF)-like protein
VISPSSEGLVLASEPGRLRPNRTLERPSLWRQVGNSTALQWRLSALVAIVIWLQLADPDPSGAPLGAGQEHHLINVLTLVVLSVIAQEVAISSSRISGLPFRFLVLPLALTVIPTGWVLLLDVGIGLAWYVLLPSHPQAPNRPHPPALNQLLATALGLTFFGLLRSLAPFSIINYGLACLALTLLILLIELLGPLGNLMQRTPRAQVYYPLCSLSSASVGLVAVWLLKRTSWNMVAFGFLASGLAAAGLLTIALVRIRTRLELILDLSTWLCGQRTPGEIAAQANRYLLSGVSASWCKMIWQEQDGLPRIWITDQDLNCFEVVGTNILTQLLERVPSQNLRLGQHPLIDQLLEAEGLRRGLLLSSDSETGQRLWWLIAKPTPRWTGWLDHRSLVISRYAQGLFQPVSSAWNGNLLRAQIDHTSCHDHLTGLPDRSRFQQSVQSAVHQASTSSAPCAVLVLDLDGFKSNNDSLGQAVGDLVLKQVAQRITQSLGQDPVAARLGGDEFAVLIPASADLGAALSLASRIIDAIQVPIVVHGERIVVRAAGGIALAPKDGLTADQLLRHADIAMCAAKSGAGGLKVYGPELSSALDSPMSLAADLRAAIARRSIKIAVQPLVNLAGGDLHSVEALARWRHPVLGAVNPEAFVIAAERGGLVDQLTELVIDQALAACHSWLARGLRVPIAVNLAARTMSDPEFPKFIAGALKRHQVPGHMLYLELTETSVIENPDEALKVVARLRDLEVKLAVDDFGTGYSSMSYINLLGPDQLKIDKSFVQRLRVDSRNEAIVRSIIDLGKNLRVAVVAEGIGDPTTATWLADLGCTIGQGYLFAEPMPTEELPDWVTRWMAIPERDQPNDPATGSIPLSPNPLRNAG